MKMRAFNDHNRSIKGTSFFQIASLEVIVTYALDK
jgi:hypothetical protein